MSKVNETKDFEKDLLEKFHQLKVSVKIDVLNILLLVTTDKVMEFLKGIAITEKIMTAHGESNETLKAIRKIQEEKRCAKKCQRNNQNVYGALRLVKDMTMTLISFVFAINGLYAAVCFVLSMDHFDGELIQHEYSLIHGFQIETANIILMIVLCTNQLMSILFNSYTLRINGWKKVFILLPFFSEALNMLQQQYLLVKKYKTQKLIAKENAKSKPDWGYVFVLLHKNRNIQLELEKKYVDTSSIKGFTAVFRNTTMNILILSIYSRPNVHALLKKSLTKDIPCFLPAMLLLNILSICLAVRSYKNKNREDFFSSSTFVHILAIFGAFMPRSFLIMLMSLDRPILMMAPI